MIPVGKKRTCAGNYSISYPNTLECVKNVSRNKVGEGGRKECLRTRIVLLLLLVFSSLGLKIFFDKSIRNSFFTGSLATSEGVNPLFSSIPSACCVVFKLIIDLEVVVCNDVEQLRC